ncbi:proteinase [Candidatus Dependentiae bacterium Noda2021]|nr:proteinase [Candidatus Dependentiae bacterium Noda2021]
MKVDKQPETHVHKKVLSNGMTVLVRVVNTLPKVVLEMWYNVGSKDEKTGEKGIAHLIEHMIFKGTDEMSESDINKIAHDIFSGYINASTSFDFTNYLWKIPSHYWKDVLPLMADSMKNVSFKEDHLSSEMKAVIQELKMYRDSYQRSLIMDHMLPAIFTGHPYQYPIIGFKQDLWNAHADDLREFYQKHYLPNNATLVVVGDVNPEEVFVEAEKNFGSIKPNPDYKKETFYFHNDLSAKQVTLVRDVNQPVVMLSWVVPGKTQQVDQIMDIVALILGTGKGSLLKLKLMDELQLVTSIEAFSFLLFEHGLFFIAFEPKHYQDTEKIITLINEQIAELVKSGIKKPELTRAIKKAQMEYYSTLEDIESQAYEIGKAFLATQDENYIFNYLQDPTPELGEQVRTILADYLRPEVMHKGILLPANEKEKKELAKLQHISDQEDQKILDMHVRTSPIEEPRLAETMKPRAAQAFNFPHAKTACLSNGLNLLYYDNKNTPKIDIVIDFKAKSFYDPAGYEGLNTFMSSLLSEGTQKYSAAQLAQELESRGMSFSAGPGKAVFSMLSADFEKGLELLKEILLHPRFDEKEIEKIRHQLLVNLKNFWDEPKAFAGQLISECIYKGHPYSKNSLGSIETITKITKKDIINAYKQFITPQGTTMAIVGDLLDYNVQEVVRKIFGDWNGEPVKEITFPVVVKQKPTEICYPINRDQVVLAFVGLSVDRKNPDYDKLLLFDQLLSGGALGSMHSLLFRLREQSGLFYTIGGSLVSQANEQPGLVLVKTIVSKDRLEEAEKAIKNTLRTALENITPSEFEAGKQAITHSLVSNFESNQSTAEAFLWLKRYGFRADFFDKRGEQLAKISLTQMEEAVKKVLNADELITVKIGRVDKSVKNAA